MKKTIFALILATLAATACSKYYDDYSWWNYDYSDASFATLCNYSSEATVWFIPEKKYADNLPEELTEWHKISVYEIAPRESLTLTFDSDDDYVTPIETYGTGDSMVFYVFHKSDWDTHSWKELREGRMWTGWCSLSVSQMLEKNSKLTYPFQ